ncbi:hypothetical protein MIND_00529100 [Mycena indigotica]|uniref:Uncharacterized protein n=1 Tax=Mycena indigotica TaxID=2126181 RepID=A0A8H6W8V4_9AGAR|nr:uncharacterized protein MIND_00529100 [Mycena indigotica]KAF7307351.1 hypothetical protein MIND_00529100 [Mycena indigotica]
MPPILRRVDSQSSDDTLVGRQNHALERQLGDTEASYFLPSRESGVNDMYLHLGFRTNVSTMARARVALVWAILRLRHPLLAAKVDMLDYNDIRFVYNPPESVEDALENAASTLEYRSQSKDELIDAYLNGPRTLSNERLSYLIVGSRESSEDFDLLICATHFLGDGMALHQCANDFFGLLSEQASLETILEDEWENWWGSKTKMPSQLPEPLETRLPPLPRSKFHQAVRRVDFETAQSKLIGGQSFPRRSGHARKTVVPTTSFDGDKTKAMLKKCKAHGVSISAALFSLCNYAWARTVDDRSQPTMMYSALNLRPTLTASAALNDTYWFLAIGYFNVVLPTFFPEEAEKTFWHRARMAKSQSTRAAKTPMLVSRSMEMARERGERARVWAREDDEKALGIWKPSPPHNQQPEPKKAKAPCVCLIGLSLLGNLDGIYKHDRFPHIKLHTLTTGSRQRAGGMLLFGYTFCGKLWLSLGYDENGFETSSVQRFWNNLNNAADTFLV